MPTVSPRAASPTPTEQSVPPLLPCAAIHPPAVTPPPPLPTPAIHSEHKIARLSSPPPPPPAAASSSAGRSAPHIEHPKNIPEFTTVHASHVHDGSSSASQLVCPPVVPPTAVAAPSPPPPPLPASADRRRAAPHDSHVRLSEAFGNENGQLRHVHVRPAEGRPAPPPAPPPPPVVPAPPPPPRGAPTERPSLAVRAPAVDFFCSRLGLAAAAAAAAGPVVGAGRFSRPVVVSPATLLPPPRPPVLLPAPRSRTEFPGGVAERSFPQASHALTVSELKSVQSPHSQWSPSSALSSAFSPAVQPWCPPQPWLTACLLGSVDACVRGVR